MTSDDEKEYREEFESNVQSGKPNEDGFIVQEFELECGTFETSSETGDKPQTGDKTETGDKTGTKTDGTGTKTDGTGDKTGTGDETKTGNKTQTGDDSNSIKNLTFQDKNYLFVLLLTLLFVLF